jgi:glutathione S-transferase
MRARMALMGKDYEHREVDLKNRPQAIYDVSPKGTVPVLVLDQGQILDESLEILHWAHPETARAEFKIWTARCDTEFKHHLDRYKYSTRFEGINAEDHRDLACAFLYDLNQSLKSPPDFFKSHYVQLQMALGPFVRQFALADRAWFDAQPWNSVHAWLEEFLQSSLFQGVMKKYPVWVEKS